jgi:hypothetical protein
MMKATVLLKCVLLGSLALLTACGGGGGSGDGGGFGPISSARISASAQSSTVPAGGTLAITVTVSNSNNTPIADGTQVTASASPSNLGGVFGVVNGQTTNSNSATTVGGRAEFIFVTNNAQGSVSLNFSTQPPGQPQSVTTSIPVTIGPPAANGNITIQAVRTQLPVNLFGIGPFIGSPYMAEMTITARTASGQPINAPRGESGGLAVAISPVTIAGFSMLDDPETVDDPATPEIENNEFLTILGSGPVSMTAGTATIFVHSSRTPGTATITASVRDPETNRLMTATQTITVVSSTPPLPTTIGLFPRFNGLYAQASGGATNGTYEVEISDANGRPVPDPTAGNTAFNNLRVEVVGSASAAANERVSGVNAAGQSVSGQSISLRTNNGIATFVFTTGARLGQATVRVTSDRADNNVDNGITDPVVAEHTVVISDGRLFALQITSAFSQNGVANPTASRSQGLSGSLDGTYSLTISALATDRQGNPVLPGTQIEFGLVDAPLSGFPEQGSGIFPISGGDGDPQENGFLFTAPSGRFITTAGGAGPGDTLLVFGQSVVGNRDLESARTVSAVNSNTSLSVLQRFNANDDTGGSINSGAVLPYLIGRAQHGNIVATSPTNSNGVASTRMNFPVSRLGQSVAVWARASSTVGSTTKLVSDIERFIYPGFGVLRISASPSSIPGNTTANVSVCLTDELGSPVQGRFITFAFSLPAGSGTIGGQSSGPLPQATGGNGCVLAPVTTNGITGTGARVTFSANGASTDVNIVAAGSPVLQASPTAFIGDGNHTVNLRLLDGAGNGLAGRAISVQCTGTGTTAIVSVAQPPTVTDANGNSTAVLSAQLMDQPGGGALWRCTFSLGGAQPTAEVQIRGRDSCAGGGGFSPPPPANACNTGGGTPVVLTLNLSNAAGAPGGTVSGTNGITCSVPASPATQSCPSSQPSGTTVSLTATPNGAPRPAPVVSGACSLVSGQASPGSAFNIQVATLTSAQTCSIQFQ